MQDDDEDLDNDDMDDDINDENIEELIGKIDSKENIKPNFPMLDDDDEEDDEDIEENYLQKFDENIQKSIISEFHPELHSHNSDEIEVLSRVVRDENGVVIDPLHKTLPFITRYEKARILGERAKQINAGAQPMVEVDINVIDGYLIALKEFEQKKIPFIIKRPLPNGGIEYWKFKDLEVI
jgi:DNA-directed RNA polymerase I, II, and III subunit RPABC2